MNKCLYNVFGNNTETNRISKMSSCRGWCKINFNKLTKVSSCRGWCKINFVKA